MMGIWPFRRRHHRKKSPSVGGAEKMHDAGAQRDNARHIGSEITSVGPERRSRRDIKRKSSIYSTKLQLQQDERRTHSFSPGRPDSITVPRTADHPPIPPLPVNLKGKERSNTKISKPVPAEKRLVGAASIRPADTQDWQRMPTLHKRSAQELAQRKSRKKRKEEHDREAEIKAMVAFMPTRPAASPTSSGRPMKWESKKMRGGLNRHMANPSSDISVPLVNSLRSSVSANSDRQPSYILNAFDMLAPRPTIRYAENPRYVPGASGWGSDRSESRKRKVSDRIKLGDEILKANKRIDDLADDLSAGELRELMERDQKRREKKKIAERIKMERKLARRQEKQREADATAAHEGPPTPSNMDRGVFGRDVVGLGIGTSAVVTSSKRKGSIESENGRGKRPADALRQDSETSRNPPNPNRSASLLTENLTPTSERSEPIVQTATVGTVGKAALSPASSPRARTHARGASSISQMIDLSRAEAPLSAPTPVSIPQPTPEILRLTSSPPGKQPLSWTSFFKRRGAKKQQRDPAPSSFSNTSRDSMQSGGHSSHGQNGYTPMRSTSNIPKRTMSKFREDLPELPISPPDSRVQSPEAETVPPMPVKSGLEDPRTRYDTPNSGYRSLETTRMRDETPTSGHRTIEDPSPEPANVLSQSLASIDSEGSWLSGRKSGSGRGTAPNHRRPDSSSSVKKDLSESVEEELGITEDEYFSRLAHGPNDEHKRQSTAMPSSDDEDCGSLASPASEKSKWGAVGRHPTVIHDEPRARSRQGLLNDFDDDSGSDVSDTLKSLTRPNTVYRATSIDLSRKHTRHMSAGSARLLDLKTRASTDAKRSSVAEED
ncbi:hypothetical protein QTJ16_006384 [Diplocarpon rosae]|uniref:Uncharacterized protein n=1 Tax=Diplocarpon rosae TaxID=946125 RepID=A0AAD9SWI7_9HELO|nr:hypothetical protein QTJ16_006384 [Diplocarpon rosae]PBP28143.1 hypothetical protein BUE80_DR000897 [Diplocarpon rosae]